MAKSIDDKVAGIMAGCGCYQQPDRSWIAKTGPMNTLTGHGKTAEEAKAALAKKVRQTVSHKS